MLAPLIGSILFTAVGLGICWLAAQSLHDYWQKLRGAQRADGVVVEMRVDHSGSETNFRYPVVRFRTPAGTELDCEASVRTDPPRHKVGDRVQVYFPPEHPEQADIVGTEVVGYVLLFLLGAPFLAAGVGMFLGCVVFGSCPVS
jgi:hypothetical protein